MKQQLTKIPAICLAALLAHPMMAQDSTVSCDQEKQINAMVKISDQPGHDEEYILEHYATIEVAPSVSSMRAYKLKFPKLLPHLWVMRDDSEDPVDWRFSFFTSRLLPLKKGKEPAHYSAVISMEGKDYPAPEYSTPSDWVQLSVPINRGTPTAPEKLKRDIIVKIYDKADSASKPSPLGTYTFAVKDVRTGFEAMVKMMNEIEQKDENLECSTL